MAFVLTPTVSSIVCFLDGGDIKLLSLSLYSSARDEHSSYATHLLGRSLLDPIEPPVAAFPNTRGGVVGASSGAATGKNQP
jgi:hypothetical protein